MTEQEALEFLTEFKEHNSLSGIIPEVLDKTIQALEEVQAYRKLGTVEGLKALKEKLIAKKPTKHGPKGVESICPCCGKWIDSHTSPVWCCFCNQKIDWKQGDKNEKLTIDEAIEDLRYDNEIDMYIRDIAPQVAEWLEELKEYSAIGTAEEFKALKDSKAQSFLPYCKPGERLWYIYDSENIMEVDIIAVRYENKLNPWRPITTAYVTVENKYLTRYNIDFCDVENRIFRTKEAAEQALR